MSRALWTHGTRAFRRAALPLASYYAVTLAVPLANGAARSSEAFVEHALTVSIVPLIAIAFAYTVNTIVGAAVAIVYSAAREDRSSSRPPLSIGDHEIEAFTTALQPPAD